MLSCDFSLLTVTEGNEVKSNVEINFLWLFMWPKLSNCNIQFERRKFCFCKLQERIRKI